MTKYNNLDYQQVDELEVSTSSSVTKTVSNAGVNSEEIELDLPNKLQNYKDKIHSIAILLTGCFEDAEEIVEQVFHEITFNHAEQYKQQCLSEHNSETMEALIHRLTYDASLHRLLIQVDNHAADLEDTGDQILKTQKYLC